MTETDPRVRSGPRVSGEHSVSSEHSVSGEHSVRTKHNPYATLLAEAPSGVLNCDLAVVGCGNLLRADDGVGPVLVRRLWEGGVPPGVRLVDGGTAGMDVAFQMRGAKRVIVVDASNTGTTAGTVFKVPGLEVEDMPPLSGLHTHSFRWDHALAFARWLLADDYPPDVTVYLIEGADFTPGGEISVPVRDGMNQVIDLIRRERAFADADR